MKKLLALVLAVLMIAGVCSGCGGSPSSDDKGTVNLIWALPNAKQSDHAIVMEKINEKLGKLMPNTTLEFKCDTSMASKWSLWMAGQTPVDIALSGYYIDLASEISKKSYKPLNELIDKYAPTIKKEMTDYDVQYRTGMVGDELYAIPNIQIHVNDTNVFSCPLELEKYLDVKALQKASAASPTATKEMYEIINSFLDKAYANTTDENYCRMIYNIKNFYEIFVKRGFEFVGGSPVACYNVFDSKNAKKVHIINFYETEEYKTFISYAAKWYAKGYISKDVLMGDVGNTSSKTYLCNVAHRNFRVIDKNHDWILQASETGNKANQIGITTEEQKYLGASTLGSLMSYTSIPLTAKNPVRAIKFLELLRTEKGADLLNTIVYGIEGKHYDKISEDIIKPYDYEGQASSSSKYGMINWQMGNMFNMKLCYPYDNSIRQAAADYYSIDQKKYKQTPVYGLTFDNANLKNVIASIISINDEYYLQMIGGTSMTKYMTTYNDMMSKLEAAGLDKILSDYQKQADNYKK